MGCGTSSAAGASSMTRDPEDFHLDHIKFQKMKVPAFDDYLIGEITPVVNNVIDIVNDINGMIDDVKDAASIVCGGFKVDIDLDNNKEHDRLLLCLQKADGSLVSEDEVSKLLTDTKVSKANNDVAKAQKALDKAMEKSYVKLAMTEGVATSESALAELDAFNKALGELRTALGDANKVVLVHKAAGVGGASCVRATLSKPVFPKGDFHSPEYTLEPLSVLDVARSKEAKALWAAESSVSDALAGLTKATKAAEGAGVSVSFELKKKKLVAKFEEAEEEETSEQVSAKAALRKAVTTANSQLFKLQKAARNANGNINMAKALVAVVSSFKGAAAGLTKDAKNVISLCPNIKFSLEGCEFDMGLKINIPDYEGMDPIEAVKKVLPGPANHVFNTILAMKDEIMGVIEQVKELISQITELVAKSDEVFTEPADKIKEAFGETEDVFAIPKAVAAAAQNAKTVATEPTKMIKCLADTFTRLTDEMTAAVNEVKAMV